MTYSHRRTQGVRKRNRNRLIVRWETIEGSVNKQLRKIGDMVESWSGLSYKEHQFCSTFMTKLQEKKKNQKLHPSPLYSPNLALANYIEVSLG